MICQLKIKLFGAFGLLSVLSTKISKDIVKEIKWQKQRQEKVSEQENVTKTPKVLVENFDGEWKEYDSAIEVIVNTIHDEQHMSLMVPIKYLDNKIIYGSITNPDILLVRTLDENGKIIDDRLETGAFSFNIIRNQFYNSNEVAEVIPIQDMEIISLDDAISIENHFYKLNNVLRRKL